jgi:hypothetical protein
VIKASQTDQTKVRNQTVVVSKCVMVVVMPLSTKVATVARLALAVLQSKPQRTATWIATFVAAVECPSSGKKAPQHAFQKPSFLAQLKNGLIPTAKNPVQNSSSC